VSAGAFFVGWQLLSQGHTRFPDAQEETLLAFLPSELVKSCARADDPPHGAVASVRCQPGHGVASVRYTLFGTQEAFTTYEHGRENATGLPEGRCSANTRARTSYDEGGVQFAGRQLCYDDGGHPVIEWSQTALRVYAIARANGLDDNALYRWWQSAGPTQVTNRKRFPDVSEAALRDLVPSDFQSTCYRATYFPRAAQASIRCRPGGSVDGVTYVSFANLSDLNTQYEGRLKGLHLSKGFCVAGERGENRWGRGNGEGRRVCYRDGKTSWLEWTTERRLVYAAVWGRHLSVGALFHWWLNHGGLG
jgi:hypothetical protein